MLGGVGGEQGEEAMHFAEFGVVIMLFMIGLELEPARLWRMRGPIFGLGGLQVLLTGLAVTGCAMAFGLAFKPALATGMILALSRAIGETAPLLVTAGVAQDTNLNPFSDRMATLPVYTYQLYKFPTLPPQASIDRAWAAALTLVVIVGILFTIARVMAMILKPKGLR